VEISAHYGSASWLRWRTKKAATFRKFNFNSGSPTCSVFSVSCYVAARDIEGDVLTLTCPSGCQTVTEKLWGTGKYREDSYVCAAAIHDGRISGECC